VAPLGSRDFSPDGEPLELQGLRPTTKGNQTSELKLGSNENGQPIDYSRLAVVLANVRLLDYGKFSILRASPVSCRMCKPVLARSTM
jgi:hypothetical protein